jgi:DNA-binding winged helix-turn-helix (wHTH) protein/predicted ATPase
LYVGEFGFDPASGRLWRVGREVTLRPKTSAVLATLAERSGEVVSKDDLLRIVWPEGFVTEGALSVCVNELRQAFGDDVRAPRYIATAHRRGYRLVAGVAAAPSPAGGDGRLFVGRDDALATLHAWWREALDGRCRAGFVSAPAGVGKTALVDAFVAGLGGGALIGRGQCVEQFGEGEPYLPVLDALAGLCRGAGGDMVTGVLRRCAPRWLVQLPGLLDDEQLQTLRERTVGASAQRMLREFGDATAELSRGRPLLLVLEDLHDGDRATVELISYLARRREPTRLLVLGSYRPAEVIARGHPLHRVVQDLGARGLGGRLALELLPLVEVADYLQARLAPRVPSPRLAADVHERTEGNALFMVTIADDLLARGLLAERDGLVVARDRLAALGMPEEVRLMIERQVDALGEPDIQLLAAAAAAGTEFAAETVAAACGAGLSVAEAERRCDRLAAERALLVRAGTASWPDGTVSGRYRFAHELYREVCYERLTPARRVQVHRRIGDRLAAGYGPRSAEIAAVLAGHFERGQDYPSAAAWLCAAALGALGRSAYPEALRHAGRVLGLLPRLPDAGQRARRELEARRALVVAAAATWGWQQPHTAEHCQRLRELAAELDNPQALATALLGLHNHAMYRGDPDAMRSCVAELDALAGPPGADSAVTLVSHFLHLPADNLAGRPGPAWERAQRILADYRPAEHGQLALLLGEELDVAAHLYAGNTLWQLGFPDQARRHSDQAVHAAREYEIPAGLARALWFSATAYLMCGDAVRVRDMAAELASLCAQHGLPLWQAGAAVLDGWAAARLGDLPGGLDRVRRGAAAWQRVTPARFGFYSRLIAELRLAAGDTAAGLAEVRSALDQVHRTGQAQSEPELLRLQGELLLAGPGNTGAAERSLRRAVRVADQRRARGFQLRAATSLARLWHAQGRTRQACELLGGMYGWFGEGHDTADLIAARTLLDQFSARETV